MTNCAIYDMGTVSICGTILLPVNYPSTQDFTVILEGPHGVEEQFVSGFMGIPIQVYIPLNEYAVYYAKVYPHGGDVITFTIDGNDYEVIKFETVP